MFGFKRTQFESLVRAYSHELYRYAYWRCRDRYVAEDLVQETFARAWSSRTALRNERAAKSWLYTILRNEHARLYDRRNLEFEDNDDLDQLIDPAHASPSAELEMREALQSLPDAYREPLLLQVLGGFSCEEIAQMMKLSTGAVMTRLSRARLALRNLHGSALRTEAR